MADAPAPREASAWTALAGNNLTHVTDDLAVKITVYVHEPQGGPERARPTINDAPIRGGAPYIVEAPRGYNVAPLTIKTRAGNNDIVIVEEF